MGICMGLRTVTDGTIERLIRDPRLVEIMEVDDPERIEELLNASSQASNRAGWFSRILNRYTGVPNGPLPADAAEVGRGENEGVWVSVDKAWGAIDFLLQRTPRGKAWPACFLSAGGQTISSSGGVTWALVSKKVREVAAFLAPIEPDSLRNLFDRAAMRKAKVYPSITWERDDPEDVEYVLNNYYDLRTYMGDAARRGVGTLISRY